MKENFFIIIESYHIADVGDQENVSELNRNSLIIVSFNFLLQTSTRYSTIVVVKFTILGT